MEDITLFTVRDLLGKVSAPTDVRVYWITTGAVWEGLQGDCGAIHPKMFGKGRYKKIGDACVLDVRIDNGGKTLLIRCEDINGKEVGK